MIRETNVEEHELTNLSHTANSDEFDDVELTPPSSPIPPPASSISSIARALKQSPIRASGRRTDAGQALGWPDLLFEIDSIENGPLQAQRFIDLEYRNSCETKSRVVGKIIGRWHIQEKDQWVLICEMVSDQIKEFYFLILLPKDARLLSPRSPWFDFLYPLLSYILVRKVSYKE
jgi:hypothetical protein